MAVALQQIKITDEDAVSQNSQAKSTSTAGAVGLSTQLCMAICKVSTPSAQQSPDDISELNSLLCELNLVD